jgi:hypothetical protein
MRKSKLIIVIVSAALLTSCGAESMDWETPSAVTDAREQSAFFPTKTDLQSLNSLNSFSSGEYKTDVLVGFNFNGTGDGSLQVEPLSCLGTEKYLLTDDFWLTPTSSSTANMGSGYSEVYAIRGDQQRTLRMAFFADKNVEDANLIGDIVTELEACKSVTNRAETLEWTSIFSFAVTSPDELRVEINTDYSYKTGQKYKGQSVKLVKQVGRNLLSVMLSYSAKSDMTLDSITSAEEDDAKALLAIFANSLVPQE